MQNTDLSLIWEHLENATRSETARVQRLVYPNLLFRAYVGIKNVPGKKFIIIEIPNEYADMLKGFKEPKGIELSIGHFPNEKPGFVSCEIASAASDLNDIFSVIAEDILINLLDCNDAQSYVDVLEKTVDRWKSFFAEKKTSIITGKEARGLLGELEFMYNMLSEGISDVVKMWNGPLRTAQDYQCKTISTEIKTTKANAIDLITISDLQQLNRSDKDYLFLCVYRLEDDLSSGVTIPMQVEKLLPLIPHEDLKIFMFKLEARGYNSLLAEKYTEKYSVCESEFYSIDTDFPALTIQNVPSAIKDAKYILSLKPCSRFKTDFTNIVEKYKKRN